MERDRIPKAYMLAVQAWDLEMNRPANCASNRGVDAYPVSADFTGRRGEFYRAEERDPNAAVTRRRRASLTLPRGPPLMECPSPSHRSVYIYTDLKEAGELLPACIITEGILAQSRKR